MNDAADLRPLTSRVMQFALTHPGLMLRALGSTEPIWRDGRRLHPAMAALVTLGTRLGRDDAEPDPARMRAEMVRVIRWSSPLRQGVHVVDRQIEGPGGLLGLRVYRPHGATGELPGVVYAHGGGFVTGDLDTHDPTCRLLADEASCVVVAVDYRLAPEHPFPAAVDDLVAAYRWVLDNAASLGIDAEAIGASGDSAGATLTAALCIEAKRTGLPQPVAQCLVYPLCDLHLRAESYRTLASGFGLTTANIEWFRSQYAPDPSTWDDPRLSPLAADDLAGLAPALVVTAGFDPLRDDGRAYASALEAAGVTVTYRCYDDLIHGFHGMLVHPDTAAAAAEVDRLLGAMLR